MPTIQESIAEGARILREAGVADERRTASLLLRHVLGIDHIKLVSGLLDSLDQAEQRSYLELIGRRAGGEPLQYLSGHQEFYGLDFIVTPAVLIPRPETEFLIDQVIRRSREQALECEPLIVDVGTGSGCIAIALASNLASARVLACDISADALSIARLNAERLGVIKRIEFVEGDLFDPLGSRRLHGSVSFIVMNPPYVPTSGIVPVQREVLDYEPEIALFAGPDGLDFHRRLLNESLTFLKPEGYLIFEIGCSQIDAIRSLVDMTNWEMAEVTNDLQGIPRTVTLRKKHFFGKGS